MPAFWAISKPPAPGRLATTRLIEPPSKSARLAFSRDWKLDPRPDSNTAILFVPAISVEVNTGRMISDHAKLPSVDPLRL